MAQVVERLTRNEQVEGSSPSIGSYTARHDSSGRAAYYFRGVAQFGSAFGSGPKGRGFESRHFDHKPLQLQGFFFLLMFSYTLL